MKRWLEFKNLDVWNNGSLIFKDLNLTINKGENIVVLGPNGSGKTTLIKLINRSIYPRVKKDSYIKLFKKENINISETRKRIGFVLTELELRLNPQITVWETIISAYFSSFYLNRHQIPTLEQSNKSEEIIRTLSISNLKYKRYKQLSDGQKRVVLIARALIHEPEILIIDEPTNMLDIKAADLVIRTLESINISGVDIIQITHNLESILNNTNRIILIKRGKIINDGPKSKILKSKTLSDLYDINLKVSCEYGYWKMIPV